MSHQDQQLSDRKISQSKGQTSEITVSDSRTKAEDANSNTNGPQGGVLDQQASQQLKKKQNDFASIIPQMSKKKVEPDDYSEGESGTEFDVRLRDLKPQAKLHRLMFFWKKAFKRAKGGALVVQLFMDIHRDVLKYGTTKNLMADAKELQVHARKGGLGHCLIMPDGKFKTVWNMIIIFLLIYTGSYVPYKIAFIDEDSKGVEIFEYIVDILFFMDIIINFFSATDDPVTGQVILDHKRLVINYLQGWFLFDTLACIPFQFFEGSSESSGTSSNQVKLVRLARLPRLYRLVRILRMFKMLKLLKNSSSFMRYIDSLQINVGVMRLFKTVLFVIFLVHLMSCMWFLAAKMSDFDKDCWAVRTGIQDSHHGYQYLVSLYWSFQTITTVGFGDITSMMPMEFVLSLFWMIFGVAVYSFTVGNISSIIANMDTKVAILSSKLQTLNAYAQHIELPLETQMRIAKFFENDSKDMNSLVEIDHLFKELPPSLRSEVVSFTHGNTINKINFFKDKNPEFLWKFMPCLKPRKLYRGDLLFAEGDVAEEVYFVLDGAFTLYTDVADDLDQLDGVINRSTEAFNVPYCLYVAGSYFGDSDCITDLGSTQYRKSFRDSTAESDADCEVMFIKKKQLDEQLQRFPEIRRYMVAIAREKQKYHQILVQSVLERYRDPAQWDKLLEARLDNRHITTYMSLKRQLKKGKQAALKAKAQEMSQLNRDDSINSEFGEGGLAATVISDSTDNQDKSKLSNKLAKGKKSFARRNTIHIEDYPKNMKAIIVEKLDKQKTKKKQVHVTQKKSPEPSADEEDEAREEKDQKDLKVVKILQDSETYLQSNLNGFCNNMSLIALLALETTRDVEAIHKNQVQKQQVIQNIEAHTSFMKDQSEDLRRQLQKVTRHLQK